MHIVYLNDDYPPRGRSSVSTIVGHLQQGMTTAGHRVSVVTTHRRSDSPHVERSADTVSLPVNYRPSLVSYACLYHPAVARTLPSILKELQPDVVHAHNVHNYLTYHALRLARQHTDRVFLTTHDVMSFAFGRLNTARYLDMNDARLSPLDHVRTVGLQYNPLRNTVIRSVFRRYVRRLVVPSQSLAAALAQHGLQHTTVIPNGLDPDAWTASPEEVDRFKTEHNLHDRRVILFGGRLSLDKGAAPLLQALDQLRHTVPNVLLFVAGAPERWQGIVNASGVSEALQAHIYNPGWLDRQAVRLANLACDVATTPSLCLDVFPTANLEAMAAGKPVVGTCFGGTPEVVTDGITGILCDPRDVRSLTTALETLLTNAALAQQMGAAGQARLAEHFSLELQTQRHLTAYAI